MCDPSALFAAFSYYEQQQQRKLGQKHNCARSHFCEWIEHNVVGSPLIYMNRFETGLVQYSDSDTDEDGSQEVEKEIENTCRRKADLLAYID